MPADSNRISLRWIEETTFGTVPTGSPTMNQMRLTGESLKGDASYTQSEELRFDRQVSDVVRTSVGASGDVNGEWSLPTYKEFIALALLADGANLKSAWSTQVDILAEATVVIAQSSNEMTLTKAATFGSLAAGAWVHISATDSENTGLFKIKEAAADAITVYNPAGVANASDTVSFRQAEQVVNGTTFRSLYMEKQFNDLTDKIRPYTGMACESWSMTVNAQNIMTTAFSMVGARELPIISGTAGDGSPTAAPTDGVCNSIDHVQAVYEADAYNAHDLTSLNFQLANNLRQRMQIGSLGPVSIGTGTLAITGGTDSFFEDESVSQDFVNDTPSMMAFTIARGDYAMAIEFPRVKYESSEQTAGGLDQDVLNAMTWRAYMHETELVSVRVALVDISTT